MKTRLSENNLLLLERTGWRSCGTDYYEHGDYPLQQFYVSEALQIAREQIRKENTKGV